MLLQSDEVADLPTLNGSMRIYVFRPVAGGRYPGGVYGSGRSTSYQHRRVLHIEYAASALPGGIHRHEAA